ncbi:MAG: hypothetical protein AAGU05_00675 [Anaerolineaceae bacterium]
MITQQECNLILDMLASGRISADEAEGLFAAIERSASDELSAAQGGLEPEPDWLTPRAWVEQVRSELYKEVETSLRSTVNTSKRPFVYIR